MSVFAKNLKQLRQRAGLTQEQLAQNLKVTRQAISRWERGHTEPDLKTLSTLAHVLNVDAEELVSGRRTRNYEQFQKRYLICSTVCFSLILILLLLQTIVSPCIEDQAKTTYEGYDAYYLTFRLLFPTVGYVSLGVFAGSVVALFCKIYLNNSWRKVVIILGVISVSASVLVIVDFIITMLIPAYKPFIMTPLFISVTTLQPINTFLFVISPIISGILLFLGFNKELDINNPFSVN